MSAKKRSIYTILAVFFSLMLSSVFVFAEGDITPASYELDGTVYSLNEYGEMTITGGTTVQQSAIRQFAYQTDIKSVTIGEGITAVGSYAFSGCVALEDVVLPEGLEKLGNSAFANCTALENIHIPKDVIIYGNSGSYYANSYYSPFTNSGIKTVTFEEGTTNIASGLFAYAKNLESIEIPKGVTTVGAGAFYNCTSLAEVVLPSKLEKIDNSAFSSCSSLTEITLPENLSIVGDGAFSGTKLTSINIPKSLCNSSQSWSIFSIDTLKEITFDEGVELIPNSMFYNCTGLETVTIPSTVKTIGNYAFSGCTGLTQVELNTGLTSIGSYAFNGCTSLTDVTLPTGLENLGNSTFGNCTALESINIPKDITVSGNNSYYSQSYYSPFTNSGIKNVIFEEGTTKIAYGLFSQVKDIESIEIPEGVTTIGEGAYYNCTSLAEVSLPSTLEAIGWSAFSGCSSLTEITLPANLSTIGENAFVGTKLTKINIPKSLCNSSQSWSAFGIDTLKEITFDEGVELIPNSMFRSCTGLETVTIPSTVEAIGDYAFKACTGLTQVELNTGLTSIGSYAFDGCTSIEGISLPTGLTSIGSYAFNGCTSLSDVTLPTGLENLGNSTFGNCTALESINIPKDIAVSGNYSYYSQSYYSPFTNSGIKNVIFEEGTTKIAYGLFSQVKDLESIDIPKGVTTIGEGAFYNCTSLAEVSLPSTLGTIGWSAFSGCSSLTEITLPANLSTIGENAFVGTKLTKINIPKSLCNSSQSWSAFGIDTLKEITFDEGVELIPNSMFRSCTGLEAVTIPSTVKTIGESAFNGCTSLSDITLSAGLTSIGSYAFNGCTSLEGISLPEGLTSIGSYAFSGCTLLSNIILPTSLENLGNSTFGNCTSLESINIPKDITVSGNYSYYSQSYYSPFTNSGIKNVTFEEGTTKIAYGLFSYAKELECIEIPEGVTTIGEGTFYNCTSLVDVSLPSTLETIGWSTFSSCSSLTEITLPANLSTIGENAFYGTKLTKINIPKSLCNSSQSWSAFSIDTLKEITFDEGVELIPSSMFKSCTGLEAVTIPSTVKTIGESAFNACTSLSDITLSAGLTSIGSYAFNGCTSLEEISLPASLTSIGSYAFNGCTSLTDVTLPTGLENLGNSTFGDCNALKSINIPKDITVSGTSSYYSYTYYSPFANSGIKNVTFEEGTTKIAYGLFSYAKELESIEIPEGVTTIGDGAFYNCTSLAEVNLPSTLETIGWSTFSCCSSLTEITLPANLSTVGSDAFNGTKITKINIPKSLCNSSQSGSVFRIDALKEITFDEGVETIPYSMFSSCTGLETVTIPSTVKTIGDYAFSGCTGLTHVVFNTGLTSIGSYAFNGCTSLTDVTLPTGLENLGNSAFGNCTALESINIPKDITVSGTLSYYSYTYYSPFANSGIKNVTFEKGTTKIDYGLFSHAKELESIEIPEGVTEIGFGAFYNCTGLTAVSLPSTLETLSGSAFYNCSSLTEIALPESLTSIGDYAFSGCTGLTEITIPSKVTSVGSSTFNGCTGITEMTFRCSSCPSGSPLYGVSNLKTVYVPPAAFEEYYRAFSSSLPSGAEIKTDFYSVSVGNLQTDGVYGTSVKLTWDEHVFSEITNYTVDANGMNVYTGSSPAVISGLETGREYTFDVYGMNDSGKKTIPASITVTPLAPEVISITTDPDNEPLPAGKVNFIVTLKDTGNLGSAGSSENAISGVLNLKKKNSQSILMSGDFVQDTADLQKFICNIDLADVNNGEYEAEVVFTDPSGCTGMSSKNIRVDSGMPNGPEIVSISPADGSMVGVGYKTVGVTARAESNLASIKIEYSLNGTDFNTLLNVKNLNTTSYNARAELPVDRVKDGDTIYVRASATDSAGNTSPVCTASYKADKTAPAVQNVSATFNDREDAVEISWIGGGEKDLAGYRIYRKDSLLGGYNLVGQKAAAADTSEYSFLDRSISPEETNYKYKVEAVDVCGNTSEETAEITTPDRSWPVAVLNCESVMELNKEYVIDASQSTDNKGIKTYHIDFGDGTTSDEAAPTHTYTETGYFTILLTVTDGDGHEDTAKKRVEVFDSTKVGTAVIHVVDENGSAVSGAPVYFDLGAENQIIRNTDSSGIARFTADKGVHMIGCVMTDNQWLPAKGEIEVEAGKNNEETLTITHHEMVEGSFDVHEMSLEEIEAAGIDTSDPDNQYNVRVTVYLKYENIPYVAQTVYNPITKEGEALEPIIVHDSSSAGGGYIIYPQIIGNNGGGGGGSGSGSSSAMHGVSAIGYIVIPIDISTLKEFFNIDLTIVNNTGEEFSMLDNVVNLNIPDGLTLMDVPSSAKQTVTINEIKGQTSETFSWILRGDKVGDYYLSADYSGILSEFNLPVTTRFEATDPVKVMGLTGMTLQVIVPESLPTGELYYAAVFKNESAKNAYKPKLETPDTPIDSKSKYYNASIDITTLDADGYDPLTDLEADIDVLPGGYAISKFYRYHDDGPQGLIISDLTDYYYEVGESYGLEVEITPVPWSYFYKILKLNEKKETFEYYAYEYGTLNKIEKVKATYTEDMDTGDSNFKVEHAGYYTVDIDSPTIHISRLTKLALVPEITDSNISAVHCKGSDVLVDPVSVGTLDGDFRIFVYSTLPVEQIQKFELWQGDKLIQENNDGLFKIDPYEVDLNEYLSVDVVKPDGTRCNKLITNIKVVEKPFKNDEVSLASLPTLDVPSDVPIIGNQKLKMDFARVKSAISYDQESNKFKIALGYEIPEEDRKEEFETFKDIVDNIVNGDANFNRTINKHRDAYNKYIKYKSCGNLRDLTIPSVVEWSKKEKDFNYEIYGYGEGTVDWTDRKHPRVSDFEGSLAFTLSFQVESKWQTVVYSIPFVVKLDVSAGMEMKVALIMNFDKAEVNLSGEMDIELPGLRLSGGVGIIDIADVSLYGRLKNDFIFTLSTDPKEPEKAKGVIEGAAGISVKVLMFTHEWEFAKPEPWEYLTYPPEKKLIRARSKPNITQTAFDTDNYTMDTEISASSEWNGSVAELKKGVRDSGEGAGGINTLQTCVYDSADPQLVVTQDGTRMMIWTGELSDRPVGNHTAVMYSVFDIGRSEWSEPAIIEDDGTADFYPSVTADGNKVYVTWMDCNRDDFNASSTLEEVASACDITVAVYDTGVGSFTSSSLTNNRNLDVSPSVMAKDGEAYVVWNSNSDSDMITMTGNNTIRYSKYSGEGWSTASECGVYDKPVTSLKAGYISSGPAVSCIIDSDGDMSTESDATVYGYMIGSDQAKVISSEEGTKEGIQFNTMNGVPVLTWCENNTIRYTEDFDNITDMSNSGRGVPSEYAILEDGESTILLSVLPSDSEEGSEIYYYDLKGNTIGDPVSVTKTNKYIHDFSAAIIDGKARTAFTSTEASVSEDDITESTDLCVLDINDYYDLSLNDISIDPEIVEDGKTVPVYLEVSNKGTVDETTVHIVGELTREDGNGTVKVDTNVDVDLPVGATEVISVDLPLESKIDYGTNYKFSIEPVSGADIDLRNNDIDVSVGYTNLELIAEKVRSLDKNAAIIAVDNKSFFDTGATVNLRQTNADGKIIATYHLGTLGAQSRKVLQIDPEEIERLTGNEGTIYVEVVADREEKLIMNNSDFICLGVKDGDEPDPAHEHTWDEGTVTTDPTCAEPGVMTYTCIHCGETKEEAIPATGSHTFREWITVTEPTVDSEGSKERVCSVCGKKETETIAKLPKDDDPDEGQTPSDTEKTVEAAKKTLNSAIANARTIAQGYYSDKSYKALLDAIAEAEALEADPNATAEQLNAAANKIEEAKKALEVDPLKELGADGTPYGVGASAEAAENAITNYEKNSDPKGTVFAPLLLKSTKQTTSSVKLSWKRVSGAKTYVVYGNVSGKSNKYKKLTTTSLSSYNVKRITKKLKKATSYKFIVVALDSTDHVVSTSKVIHAATKSKGNYTKVTTKAKKNKVSLKNGKSFKLGAKATGKKVKKYVSMRYESTKPQVATVSKSGKITAKSKGTCYVYVFAQNGIYKKIKVTVK